MLKYSWSIIGHESQLESIERDIQSNNLSHSYLFSGSNNIGKYTVAKKITGILQCDDGFCHSCKTCIQIEKGSHIDTIELVDDGESIKISDIRILIKRLSLSSQSKYKILLIQNIERMTIDAANSFLKSLEEPSKNTIFILTTNNINRVLATILSRLRILKFNVNSPVYLEKKLYEIYPNIDKKIIKQASLFSIGKTGKAISLIKNPDSLAFYVNIYNDIQELLKEKNISDRFSYVNDIANDKKQIETFLNILTNVLRFKLLKNKSAFLIKNLSKISETAMLLKKNINSRLVLENLMLSL